MRSAISTRSATLAIAGMVLAAGSLRDAQQGVGAKPAESPQLAGDIVAEVVSAGDEPFGQLGGLAFAPGGGVWVADSQAETVYLFDSAGNLANRIGRSGDGPGELREPCCITLALQPAVPRCARHPRRRQEHRGQSVVQGSISPLSEGSPCVSAGIVVRRRDRRIPGPHQATTIRGHRDCRGRVSAQREFASRDPIRHSLRPHFSCGPEQIRGLGNRIHRCL